jgi:hypothetical protein
LLNLEGKDCLYFTSPLPVRLIIDDHKQSTFNHCLHQKFQPANGSNQRFVLRIASIIKGLRVKATLSAKRLCMGYFASFAKIFVGSYFGKGVAGS